MSVKPSAQCLAFEVGAQYDRASAECCYFRPRLRIPLGQGKQRQILRLFLTRCGSPAWVTCPGCLSMCLGKYGAYDPAPYSRWSGHAEYSRAITSLHLGTVFLFIQPEISLAFLATTSHCWLPWSLWSTQSPQSLSHMWLLSPVSPAPVFVQSGFDSQRKTFRLLLFAFIWLVLAPGSSLLRFLFCFGFIFQFNILAGPCSAGSSWDVWWCPGLLHPPPDHR